MPNRLINETSPYLLQHANNPVDWYPYGNEALEEARRRDCPVIISIGYSACHWCHVMEHESFSVPEVADIMNRHFVCIKVDREERPDVDQIYLNAVQLLHGQGGWPLNCFALPDGRPFWGGTYFRPEQWKDILLQLSGMYHNNFEDIISQAERIHKGIYGMGLIDPPADSVSISHKTVEDAWEQLSFKLDRVHGGTRGAPKFPMPSIWQFVLRYYHISNSGDALGQLKLTLDKMSMGGIFDQVGGGFARYSTDAEWKIPHFEKMLYDNAQLAALYADGYRATGKQAYLSILTRILDFVNTELLSPEGAFYAALDADSEGEEGRFYVWKKSEIMELLPEYGELLCRYWGVEKQGYWEKDRNILLRPLSDDQFAMLEHLSAEELRQLVSMASRVLYNHRKLRVSPGLDDKVIFSWNALMIKGYAVASLVADNQEWRNTAEKAASFLLDNMVTDNGSIRRTWKNGSAKINGFLDDYAFMADALIELYQLTFTEEYLFKAKLLADSLIQRFSQHESPLFWYLPEDNEDNHILKISRVLETNDGVEPSGNAVMAGVLLSLGNYFEDQSYITRSLEMCRYMEKNIVAYPSFHAHWASVTAAHVHGVSVVATTGDDAVKYARKLQKRYSPFTLFAASANQSRIPVLANKLKEGKTLIYRCVNHVCEAPVDDPALL